MWPKTSVRHCAPAVLNVTVTCGSPGWLEKLEPSAKLTRKRTEVRLARPCMSLRRRLVIGSASVRAEAGRF